MSDLQQMHYDHMERSLAEATERLELLADVVDCARAVEAACKSMEGFRGFSSVETSFITALRHALDRESEYLLVEPGEGVVRAMETDDIKQTIMTGF